MDDNNVINFEGRDTICDPLTQLLKSGAQELLKQAIELEIQEYMAPIRSKKHAMVKLVWFATAIILSVQFRLGLAQYQSKSPRLGQRQASRLRFIQLWFHRMFARRNHWKQPSRGSI